MLRVSVGELKLKVESATRELQARFEAQGMGSMAREILEDTYGGTSIFLQGASGDTGPMISYSADPAVSSQC